MSLPFWRAFVEHVRMPVRFDPVLPVGARLITMFDDGSGPRPVTELEWKMHFAFWHIDTIVAESACQLDELHRQTASRITALR